MSEYNRNPKGFGYSTNEYAKEAAPQHGPVQVLKHQLKHSAGEFPLANAFHPPGKEPVHLCP